MTILGCGSSGGVPRIGNNWGNCDPNNPKNRRRRCSVLVQRFRNGKATTALIDTSPDIREQLLEAEIGWLDGVLITHEHADHTHGIDDLRVVALNGRQRVAVYANDETGEVLKTRFGYCFVQPPGSSYPPILDLRPAKALEPLVIDGDGGPITLTPFDQVHGSITAFGVRIGTAAYSSDLSDIPDASLGILSGLDTWIVDALRHQPHPSHFCVADALHWIGRLTPKAAVLTNLHTDLDYVELAAMVPPHVQPAYDMMRLEVPFE
ncbi:MAG: MBL fold metallo-hydrolase [Rhodobiaceae bacterium]|nr:MBL fold metallo-hydrolase [Rhodobiaceae bacterium]